MNDLRITLVQGATRWHDPVANRDYYGRLIAPLHDRTDLGLLPETFTSGFSNDAIAEAETMDGPTVAWVRDQARILNAAVCGSVQLRDGDGVYNRLLFATPDGELHTYDKRHLFRFGREHERYAAGRDRLVVDWRGWRICPLVCYDLRFPVFSRNRYDVERPAQLDYDLLLYVANWPAARAYAWKTLLRARAIRLERATLRRHRTDPIPGALHAPRAHGHVATTGRLLRGRQSAVTCALVPGNEASLVWFPKLSSVSRALGD